LQTTAAAAMVVVVEDSEEALSDDLTEGEVVVTKDLAATARIAEAFLKSIGKRYSALYFEKKLALLASVN